MQPTETQNEMAAAADWLLENYQNDEELTVFTVLDCESFHFGHSKL